jgi:hypothetical protein
MNSSSTIVMREAEVVAYAKSLSGAFGVVIEPVHLDAPGGGLAIKVSLPSKNVDGGPDGMQVDYVMIDLATPGSPMSPKGIARRISNVALDMIQHEWDEWFSAGGVVIDPPTHDFASTRRHWTIPNNCASAETAL